MPAFDEPVELDGVDLFLREDGAIRIQLNVSSSDIRAGGSGTSGELHLYDPGDNRLAVFTPSRMWLRNSDTGKTIDLDAENSEITVGGQGGDGVIYLNDSAGNRLTVLAPTFTAWRSVRGYETVRVDGELGDITLSGADCAELFEVGIDAAREPGTVLVFDDQEHLWPCQTAYDRRVAGIVSGANGLRPGVVLGGVAANDRRVPLALAGKAYCKVDAQYGAIDAGDLLTSSPTAGHAMQASDPREAFGAVIGKALRSHANGVGMIPVLIALQ